MRPPNLSPPKPHQPSPPKLYTGPAVPTAYDTQWQLFTNLTPDQIAWFQAQPEWANFLAWVALDPVNATGNDRVSTATINAALQAAGQTPAPPVVVTPTPGPSKL